jgi:hypothetical protein
LLQVWLKPDAYDAFVALAKREGRTPSNLMRHALAKAVGFNGSSK